MEQKTPRLPQAGQEQVSPRGRPYGHIAPTVTVKGRGGTRTTQTVTERLTVSPRLEARDTEIPGRLPGGPRNELHVGLGEPALLALHFSKPPHVLLLQHRDDVVFVEVQVVVLLGSPGVQGLRLQPLHLLTLWGRHKDPCHGVIRARGRQQVTDTSVSQELFVSQCGGQSCRPFPKPLQSHLLAIPLQDIGVTTRLECQPASPKYLRIRPFINRKAQ